MNENALQVANGMRLEWIAFPVLIAVLLWIWAALVVTRRQPTTQPYYYYGGPIFW